MYSTVMKGSLTATSSTSSLCRATLATNRPILPKPTNQTAFETQSWPKPQSNFIKVEQNTLNLQIQTRKKTTDYIPLIPILILPAKNYKEDMEKTELVKVCELKRKILAKKKFEEKVQKR